MKATRSPGPDMQTQASRHEPAGLHAGAPRTRVQPPLTAFSLVAPELVDCEQALYDVLASKVQAVEEIGRYLAASGGKRLRPLFTALGARAAGHRGAVHRLMCAGELIHLGSLLHDDVVDEADARRGRPAAHKVFTNPSVILAGDFCVARGMLIAAQEGGLRAVTELTRTVAEMSEGEISQLLNAGHLELGVDAYYEVIDRKSASLMAWCAAAGAWAIGQEAHADALHSFGRRMGVAFQIADDVLDYSGEERLTGKPAGQDLAQRKPTLPLLLAMERRPGLKSRLMERAPTEAEVPALVAEVVQSGAAQDALDVARAHVRDGLADLTRLPETPARAALVGLAHHLVERVS